MELSIFLAISIDNFPSISRQAVRLSWSLSSMFTCDPLHSAIQFPNEVPSKYNAEHASPLPGPRELKFPADSFNEILQPGIF